MWTLPNILTLLNLISGCIGITLVLNGSADQGLLWVAIGVFFDYFDGFVARLMKITSPLGKELDSLADMVTFGVLPSIVIYKMMLPAEPFTFAAYLAFIIVAFSAMRLAKFNNDTRQSDTFYGLPTPSNAIFLTSLPFVSMEILDSYWVLLTISIIFSVLLVVDLRMFALKFKDFSFVNNKWKYLAIVAAVTCLVIFRLNAFPIIILGYILVSILIQLSRKKA